MITSMHWQVHVKTGMQVKIAEGMELGNDAKHARTKQKWYTRKQFPMVCVS